MDDQTFTLLMDKLKTIEQQNQTQLELMQAHIKEDNKVHRVVDRHSVYFSFFSVGIPAGLSYLGKKLGVY